MAPLTVQAKKTLRVMTYNIHVGVGMDKKLDLQRIAEVINRERPDLVGLQEVMMHGSRAVLKAMDSVILPTNR